MHVKFKGTNKNHTEYKHLCVEQWKNIQAYNRNESQPAVWKGLQSIWNKTPVQANDSIMCNDTYIRDVNQDDLYPQNSIMYINNSLAMQSIYKFYSPISTNVHCIT